MKVLMSVPDKRVRGGPPSHLYLLADSLSKKGLDVKTFVFGGRVHNENLIQKIFGRLWDLIKFPLYIIYYRPDIVQLNSAFNKQGLLRDVFFVPVARILGQRVIIKFHGSRLYFFDNPNIFWRIVCWVVIRGSNVICLLSTDEKKIFRKHFPKDCFVLVKNALDFTRYQNDYEFCTRYKVPKNKPMLLFIARFLKEKGISDVIESLPKVLEKYDVHMVFVGDGPVRQENEKLCKDLGVEGNVTFTGYVPEEETVEAYLAADMLVFPTYHQEGMPMVIFHSLACGVPIVTTKIRAANDWLVEGEHCLFVPPQEPVALSEKILSLLDDSELREKMSAAGPKVVEGFEMTKVADEYLILYSSLIDDKNSCPKISELDN